MYKVAALALAASAALTIAPAAAADTKPHIDTSGVNMQPAYPATALATSERGAAVIGVNVGETGKVNYAYPLQTSGFDDLDSAAIAAVMGWHFIPATDGGKNVAGDTAVELIFQPPDAQNTTSQPAASAPKPAHDFLPKSFQIEADRGQYDTKDGSILCSNGRLRTTMQFHHVNGGAASEWKPAANISVTSGKDDIELTMFDPERYTNPQEAFEVQYSAGNTHQIFHYPHMTDFGEPQTVSLSWDSSGKVTASVGEQERQAQLNTAPTKFSFSSSSGVTEFTNSVLVCFPPGAK